MKPEEALKILKSRYLAATEKERQADALAIEALEKQIPKEPTEGFVFREEFRNMIAKRDKDMASRTGSCCPTCGIHIGESEAILKRKIICRTANGAVRL